MAAIINFTESYYSAMSRFIVDPSSFMFIMDTFLYENTVL